MFVVKLTFSNAPEMNNIFSHNGNPPISYFSCDTTKALSECSVQCGCSAAPADVSGFRCSRVVHLRVQHGGPVCGHHCDGCRYSHRRRVLFPNRR